MTAKCDNRELRRERRAHTDGRVSPFRGPGSTGLCAAPGAHAAVTDVAGPSLWQHPAASAQLSRSYKGTPGPVHTRAQVSCVDGATTGPHLLHELRVAARDGRQLHARKGERLLLPARLHERRELAPPHLEQNLLSGRHREGPGSKIPPLFLFGQILILCASAALGVSDWRPQSVELQSMSCSRWRYRTCISSAH